MRLIWGGSLRNTDAFLSLFLSRCKKKGKEQHLKLKKELYELKTK